MKRTNLLTVLSIACLLSNCKSEMNLSEIRNDTKVLQNSSSRIAVVANTVKGMNWADGRDNFVDGWVIPSGLSASDNYATVQTKSDLVLTGFQNAGANTIRLPINPNSVLESWWNAYTGAIDKATGKGMNVVLCCWESASSKDGKVDDSTQFWNMWQTVITKYGSNDKVLFEVFNEPHGYSSTELRTLYADFLTNYPNVTRDRIILDGTGYADNVTDLGADSRFNSCLLSLHNYTWFGGNLTTPSAWEQNVQNHIGSYGSRTIVTEFGAGLTGGKNYLGAANGDVEVAYLQGMTNKIKSSQMGSIYWPGLRDGDSYSLFTFNGSVMSLNNISALARIQYGWSMIPVTNGSTYKVTARHSGKVLDINAAATTNGAILQQWDWANGSNQKWIISETDPGVYKFIAQHSSKGLDVNGGATAYSNGAYLEQWDYYGGDNQKFAIVSIGGGYYAIVAKHSGKVFDVNGQSTANGAGILQWQYSGNTNQNWQFSLL